jgi:hypothetical protein
MRILCHMHVTASSLGPFLSRTGPPLCQEKRTVSMKVWCMNANVMQTERFFCRYAHGVSAIDIIGFCHPVQTNYRLRPSLLEFVIIFQFQAILLSVCS